MAVNWNEVGAIGQWAGSFASAAAVIVSLTLARGIRKSRVRMNISSPSHLISKDGQESFNIYVDITNDGPAPVTITSVNWYVTGSPVYGLLQEPKRLDMGDVPIRITLDVHTFVRTIKRMERGSGIVKVMFQVTDSRGHILKRKYKIDIDRLETK